MPSLSSGRDQIFSGKGMFFLCRSASCSVQANFFLLRSWRFFLLLYFLLSFLFLHSGFLHADEGFKRWVADFRVQAQAAGVTAEVYDHAFEGLTLDPEVVALAKNQPEFTIRISSYLKRMLSEDRVNKGLSKAKQYEEILSKAERTYGVERSVVLAIWGLETNYGTYMGEKYIVRSLATLAYSGVREGFCHKQLIAALLLIQNGHMSKSQLLGSWAGAMGHTQFIPTTLQLFSADIDGDGRHDVRGNLGDALASTANYLRASGWEFGSIWGHLVSLPEGFDYSLADDAFRSTEHWNQLGVRHEDGSPLSPSLGDSSLFLPTGAQGSAFLLGRNFRVIMRYNNSRNYALAVGLLSDRLAGKPPVFIDFRFEGDPLSFAQARELQAHLIGLGYYEGKVDGRIGELTRKAIRSYQRDVGLLPDGYADRTLLQYLRASED